MFLKLELKMISFPGISKKGKINDFNEKIIWGILFGCILSIYCTNEDIFKYTINHSVSPSYKLSNHKQM